MSSSPGEVSIRSGGSLDFSVTSEQYKQWYAAHQGLDRRIASRFGALLQPASPTERSIEKAVEYLEGEPSARRAIERAGMSVRGFVVTTVALEQEMRVASQSGARPDTIPMSYAPLADSVAPPMYPPVYPPAYSPAYPGYSPPATPYPPAYPQPYPPAYTPTLPPRRFDSLPARVDTVYLPSRDSARRDVLPRRDTLVPQRDSFLPRRDSLLPRRDSVLPRRDSSVRRDTVRRDTLRPPPFPRDTIRPDSSSLRPVRRAL